MHILKIKIFLEFHLKLTLALSSGTILLEQLCAQGTK
jgi:hypothetical protein